MLPILYEENETEFKNNGIGRLSDLISCSVTEKKNDTYTLDMTYPVNGKHFNELKPGKIIFAIHDNSKTGQPFDIVSVSTPSHGTVRVTARHISYRLQRLYTAPLYILIGENGVDAVISELNRKAYPPTLLVFGDNPFNITCELESGDYPVYPDAPMLYDTGQYSSVYDILFGTSMGILSDDKGWGECGEYIRDKFDITLVKHRGSDKGIQMRTGKNVRLLTVSYDMETYYTGAIPYWDGKDPVSGGDKHVDLRDFDDDGSGIVYADTDFPYDRLIPVDLSGLYEQPPTEQELRDGAQKYLKQASDRSVAYPQSYQIDLVHNPDNTAEMQSADLCDFVQVQDVTLGVNVNLEVTEVTYDVVHERYTSMVVGSKRKTIGKLIKDKFASPLKSTIDRHTSEISDLSQKTTVSNYVSPVDYDPSDPDSVAEWTDPENPKTGTFYDADGNEVEQVGIVNRKPVFAHKGGSGGGGGDVIQWRGGGWNVEASEITPSATYIALLSTVDAIMIDKVDSVYIDGFCIPINKALLESGDIVVVSTLAGMHIVSHNQYAQGMTVRNYTNRSYGVAKLSITLSEYNVNGAGTVKVGVQIEQFYGSTKDVVQGFNLSTQQRGSVMFGVTPFKSMMVYGTFTYTESGSMSFESIETLEKAGS